MVLSIVITIVLVIPVIALARFTEIFMLISSCVLLFIMVVSMVITKAFVITRHSTSILIVAPSHGGRLKLMKVRKFISG